MTRSPAPRCLSFGDADALLDGMLSSLFEGDYDTVLFFDGDLSLDEDFLKAIGRIDDSEPDIVVVTGDLTVAGSIALYEDMPGLYVGGFTRADTLEGGDAEIYIGDGSFTHLVYGYYNHGILSTGTVETPWVVNSDHDLRVKAPNALWVDNHGSGNSGQEHFTRNNIAESFVPEIVNTEYDMIDIPALLGRLRAGLPVLLPSHGGALGVKNPGS